MYGLADSPVDLAAWMINHDEASYQDIADAFAGNPVGGLNRAEETPVFVSQVSVTFVQDTSSASSMA